MAKSFKEIASNNTSQLDEVDIRYFIDKYLNKTLGQGARCEAVEKGKVTIISNNPTLKQELKTLEQTIRKTTKQQTDYDISEIQIKGSF